MGMAMWSTAEGQAVLLGGLLLLLLSLLFLLRQNGTARPQLKLPPSPFPSLPFLGNLFHLANLQASAHSIRAKLGPIFTLYAGRTPLIFITSSALAHEALVEKSRIFAARPFSPSRIVFTNNYRSINSASYGPHWRSIRRNLVHDMLNMPNILSFKPVRLSAIDHLISRIRTQAQPISVVPIIRTAMFELLLFMCFGFRMSEGDALQTSNLMDEMLRYSAGTLQFFYDFLGFPTWKNRQRGLALQAKQVQIFSSHFEKHHELKKLGQIAPGSYVETLLHMDGSISLSTVDMAILCTEFLAAGTDTTATTLEWAMACIVDDSSIQTKIYNEMYDVVGNENVEEKDLPNLTYLQAVIKETLRLHPPGPFLLPHCVSEDCKIGGYDIPTNAVVMFNITFIAKDPEIWEEAFKFQPERFMSSDVDMTGSKEMTMMPFGAGRRICPGLGLASMHLELFAARLVQAFEWSVFPSGAMVDYTETIISTVRMKHPLRVLVKERIRDPASHKDT